MIFPWHECKSRKKNSASVVTKSINRKYKNRSSTVAKSIDGEQSSVTETNKDIKGMQEELTGLKAELSLYSKEYAAATTPEEKSSIRALIILTKTTYNALNSKYETALSSGKSNLKYLCQSLLPLTVYRFIIYTILIIYYYYYYQLSLYP